MEVIYWNEKIEKFIKNLDNETSMRVDRTIGILERIGHLIQMPDSKSLGKGLFELRIHGKRQVLIVYLFKNDKAYVVHGFVKKTGTITRGDIEYARRVQKEVITDTELA